VRRRRPDPDPRAGSPGARIVSIDVSADSVAEPYRREGVAACPVEGLAPCELAVAWRRGERRRAMLDLVECLAAAAPGTCEPFAGRSANTG
jgi:hypothetical protein